jgi:hypothetical protein
LEGIQTASRNIYQGAFGLGCIQPKHLALEIKNDSEARLCRLQLDDCWVGLGS